MRILILLFLFCAYAHQWEQQVQPEFAKMIDSYIDPNLPYPFIQHLNYFSNRNTNKIDIFSIASNWSNLTREYYPATFAKAWITMKSANLHEIDYHCPFTHSYEPESMMPLLKHPADTRIVNSDGSINRQNLLNFMNTNFVYDKTNNFWYLPQINMQQHLRQTAKEDQHLTTPFYLPSWEKIASNEWEQAFDVFGDVTVNDNYYISPKGQNYSYKGMTAKTFLEFYFKGTQLYQKINVPLKDTLSLRSTHIVRNF